ncbi:hypothetical protein [Paraburkholderia caribensis]|uniref:hypothetical protein n=1 Tax=Paraburkholderia caribensis TaxID=75105 RepID=UPI001B805063|nr:hypothetical protein [Paraburkholderia caribensis]
MRRSTVRGDYGLKPCFGLLGGLFDREFFEHSVFLPFAVRFACLQQMPGHTFSELHKLPRVVGTLRSQ